LPHLPPKYIRKISQITHGARTLCKTETTQNHCFWTLSIIQNSEQLENTKFWNPCHVNYSHDTRLSQREIIGKYAVQTVMKYAQTWNCGKLRHERQSTGVGIQEKLLGDYI
jgi:hypothetical protein